MVYDITRRLQRLHRYQERSTISASSSAKVEAFAYCKSSKMATVMFIFVQDGSIIGDSSRILFWPSPSQPDS